MQASKIVVGKQYAVQFERDSPLLSLSVSSVTTVRHKSTGSPHDYTSYVAGYVDKLDGKGRQHVDKIAPEKVMGPFEEYKELVAQRALAQQEKDRKEQEEQQFLYDTAEMLYKVLGFELPKPDRPGNHPVESYNAPIRKSYNGVEVRDDALPVLNKLLTELLAKRKAA